MAWAIAASPLTTKLFVAPGNPGTGGAGRERPIAAGRHRRPGALRPRAARSTWSCRARRRRWSPGWPTRWRTAGIHCCGPSPAAAQLEGSKAFTKELCDEAGIPTALLGALHRPGRGARLRPPPRRADRGQGGRPRRRQGRRRGRDRGRGRGGGARDDAGPQSSARPGPVVIEECLDRRGGAACSRCATAPTPCSSARRSDHKRVGDGDTGPNTGGMGAFSPVPGFDPAPPWTPSSAPPSPRWPRRGTPFRGILFAGLMLTATGPRLIEYNVRFGDPECQALLPRLRSDLLPGLLAACDGELGALRPALARRGLRRRGHGGRAATRRRRRPARSSTGWRPPPPCPARWCSRPATRVEDGQAAGRRRPGADDLRHRPGPRRGPRRGLCRGRPRALARKASAAATSPACLPPSGHDRLGCGMSWGDGRQMARSRSAGYRGSRCLHEGRRSSVSTTSPRRRPYPRVPHAQADIDRFETLSRARRTEDGASLARGVPRRQRLNRAFAVSRPRVRVRCRQRLGERAADAAMAECQKLATAWVPRPAKSMPSTPASCIRGRSSPCRFAAAPSARSRPRPNTSTTARRRRRGCWSGRMARSMSGGRCGDDGAAHAAWARSPFQPGRLGRRPLRPRPLPRRADRRRCEQMPAGRDGLDRGLPRSCSPDSRAAPCNRWRSLRTTGWPASDGVLAFSPADTGSNVRAQTVGRSAGGARSRAVRPVRWPCSSSDKRPVQLRWPSSAPLTPPTSGAPDCPMATPTSTIDPGHVRARRRPAPGLHRQIRRLPDHPDADRHRGRRLRRVTHSAQGGEERPQQRAAFLFAHPADHLRPVQAAGLVEDARPVIDPAALRVVGAEHQPRRSGNAPRRPRTSGRARTSPPGCSRAAAACRAAPPPPASPAARHARTRRGRASTRLPPPPAPSRPAPAHRADRHFAPSAGRPAPAATPVSIAPSAASACPPSPAGLVTPA